MTAAATPDTPTAPATGGAVAPAGTPVPPLARATLDRAAHRRTDPGWLAEAWSRGLVLVVDMANRGTVLLTADPAAPELVLVGADEVGEHQPDDRWFLGLDDDGTPVFALAGVLPTVADARTSTLRESAHLLSDRDAGLLTTALALANWHARHRFSSVTGAATTVADGGWSRIDGDGKQLWPRTDPAMIALVHDGVPGPDGRCLLGHNASWPDAEGRRRFSCLAGFVEPGESAEAAVVREAMEEVGVVVDHIRYAGSQAWPFPGSLMLGFLARADPAQPVRCDPAEIAHARWFSRREIGAAQAGEPVDAGDGLRLALPPALSIARFLMDRWLAGEGA